MSLNRQPGRAAALHISEHAAWTAWRRSAAHPHRSSFSNVRAGWRVNPAFGVHAVAHHDARCNAMWSSSRAAKARDSTGSLLRSPRLVDTHAAWGVSRTTTCAAGVDFSYGPLAGQRLVRGPCAVGSLSIVASYGWRAPCTTGEGGRGGDRKGRVAGVAGMYPIALVACLRTRDMLFRAKRAERRR
jgi:hypothetical protein